jgi:hypothetical protein
MGNHGKGLIMRSRDIVCLVSAQHRHPDYCFQDTEVKVRVYEDGTAIARHPDLGCGKTGIDTNDAIDLLFHDHACFAITWREQEQ